MGQESLKRPGWRPHTTKLDDEDINLIRMLYKDGLTIRVIADKFDVSKSTIHRITSRQSWKDIP